MTGDGGQVWILTIIEEFGIFCIGRIIHCFSKWFVNLYLMILNPRLFVSIDYYDFSARCILNI